MSDGVIIILSYPDTVVRPAYWEGISKLLPKIGIGSKHAVQAGHAALLLIEKNKETINYFDFGRYITTFGNGRVRCKETDAELQIPLTASFKNNVLTNLEEILLWIEKHPDKTHGEGRLVATINDQIDFRKAQNYIQQLIAKKEIPYGAFLKEGSNCARFVTDTLIIASTNYSIKKSLKKSNYITPSPIGNVMKGTSTNIIYTIENQQISIYKNRSIVKEYRASFFKKFPKEPDLTGTEKPNLTLFNLKNATWLGGIGSGAWFYIEAKITEKIYKIARYTANGEKDFEGNFLIDNPSLNLTKPFNFEYPSNCLELYINQNGKKFFLKVIDN